MPRTVEPAPPDRFEADDVGHGPDGPAEAAQPTEAPIAADFPALPVVGITRRRMAVLVAAFVSVWVVILFARQVGEASAATARAEAIRAGNAALAGEIAALEDELELIQTRAYIDQQARAYGLGGDGEVSFALRPDAPALGKNAPGSASVRLGAGDRTRTPLESWLSLLFGPDR